MAKEKGHALIDLNEILFEQLDRLSKPDLKGDGLAEEITRSKAVGGIAHAVIANATLAFNAAKEVAALGGAMPAMIGYDGVKEKGDGKKEA